MVDRGAAMTTLAEKQQIEIDYWRTPGDEAHRENTLRGRLDKARYAVVFLDCIERHRARIASSGRVLELGGGQGWASCLYRREFPDAEVIASDISPHALAALPDWARWFDVPTPGQHACRSYDIPEPDGSLDRIFCFEAAHHFIAHRRTLRELHRVLRPGGMAFYLHEPVTPRWLYPLAYRRVNRKRPEVPEDVLIVSRIRALAAEAGLDFEIDYDPSTTGRGPYQAMYFSLLAKMPVLCRLVPATAHLIFRRPEA